MFKLFTLGGHDLKAPDGGSVQSILAQPKRLALLTYLALATPRGFHRRDSLLALFWPELDPERARAALRKSVYHLRRSLSDAAIVNRGDDELRLAGGALWSDAVAFEDALREGNRAGALQLYRGDLLPGFHVSEAPGFERWLEGKRERLRRLAADAAGALAAQEEQRNSPAAVDWARRAMELAPEDEAGLRRLIALLHRQGDPVSALRAYEEFRRRIEAELDVAPSRETEALAEEIRSRANDGSGVRPDTVLEQHGSPEQTGIEFHGAQGGTGDPVPRSAASDTQLDEGEGGKRPWHRRSAWRWVTAAGLGAIAIAIAFRVHAPATSTGSTMPAVAVGMIHDFTGGSDSTVSRALPHLLATRLAAAKALQVVSVARIHELMGEVGIGAETSQEMRDAAQSAGTRYLIEGAVYRASREALQLDLRSVDLQSGAITGAYSVTAPNAFTLADRAAREILNGFGVSASGEAPGDVTARSLVAYRLYEEGLRAYYENDSDGADRFFTAALAEDSTFAMAAYYSALAVYGQWDSTVVRFRRALRLARAASERERLLIRAHWGALTGDPNRLAVAETLAVRYPLEPDGHLFLGLALLWDGAFLEAVPHLRRVVAMDSLSLRGERARCLACDAFGNLAMAYTLADSMAAAERVIREWIRLQPESQVAWLELASCLELQGRFDEAAAAWRNRMRLNPYADGRGWWPIRLAIRKGDFEEADQLTNQRLREASRNVSAVEQSTMLWFRMISYRAQGRLREALIAAQRFRTLEEGGGAPGYSAIQQGWLLFEMGHYREAAALLDSIARNFNPTDPPSRMARHQVWAWTHAAAAYAALGDTTAVHRLADTIQVLGPQSGYGRDRRLYHHLLGYLALARGEADRAEAEFRQAVFSPTAGYTRTNLELARLLLREQRPEEAVAILQPALRGGLDAANLYVTHTELHELLGRAHEAAGQPDSAVVHYRWVDRAWRKADPRFHARREWVRSRLAALADTLEGT